MTPDSPTIRPPAATPASAPAATGGASEPGHFRLAVLADGAVGAAALSHVLTHYPDDLVFVGCGPRAAPVIDTLAAAGWNGVRRNAADLPPAAPPAALAEASPDVLLLAWWPDILRRPWLAVPARAVINFHPSLLPWCRGKNYNFWALVEQAPFGVTLHLVDDSVDGGAVLFQQPLATDWSDTGATLYHRAQTAMVELFKTAYPRIRRGDWRPVPQSPSDGSFHRAAELDAASTIDLDRSYRARDLLNLLRARTFAPHPACRFTDGGRTWEARIHITPVDSHTGITPSETLSHE
ncbi:MAG: formyltransferase family protein [Alphaproteobacteria bacterium]